eukprot:PhM_4_TR4504/c0_g1_i1/m.7727
MVLALSPTTDSTTMFEDGRPYLKQLLSDVHTRPVATTTATPVAFVFCGQGSQWHGMLSELLESSPVVRDVMLKCERAFRKFNPDLDLMGQFARTAETCRFGETTISQPAIFSLQVCLVEVWRRLGVTPSAVVGHSLGEVAAAYAAGILTLEQAAAVVHYRSTIMETGRGLGAMLTTMLSESDLSDLLARHPNVVVACYNSKTTFTLSGDKSQIDSIEEELKQRAIYHRRGRRNVEYPFHSPYMMHVVDTLRSQLSEVLQDVGCTNLMESTAVRDAPARFDAEYWSLQVPRPVHFSQALDSIIQKRGITTFIEIGPHPALASYIKEALASNSTIVNFSVVAHTLHRDHGEVDTLHSNIRALVECGIVTRVAVPAPPMLPRLELPYWAESTDSLVDLLESSVQTPVSC